MAASGWPRKICLSCSTTSGMLPTTRGDDLVEDPRQNTWPARFAPFAERMRAAGLPDLAVRTFAAYHGQLVEGATGLVSEAGLAPLGEVPDADALGADLAEVGAAAMEQAVTIKLNGGLGTGMGLAGPKSLLPVKGGATFLDIIARQAVHSRVPLLLMNSFATREASEAALAAYPELAADGLPLGFQQHMVPKVDAATGAPAEWPQDPGHTWCPPGHGDIYTALVTRGVLDRLLAAGRRFAFVSNADNLGAVLDARLLGYLVSRRLPFMMEVADRTDADRKGGHLARRASTGQLILREAAQCPEDEREDFQDIARHRYFNTNNLWLDLAALRDAMQARDHFLGLPMIRNRKTVDPRDRTTPAVYQLETAMGAAIEVFAGAAAIRVPRTRFAPVKTCDDLLVVRSDACVLTADHRVVPNPLRRGAAPPTVSLDPAHFRAIEAFEQRFAGGPPSLLQCRSLTVRGDVRFGRGVEVRGDVTVEQAGDHPLLVPDGASLEG